MRKILLYHVPVVAYGAVILLVSSIPDLRTPEIRLVALDKVAHFAEYALFAFLTFRSCTNLSQRVSIGSAFWLSLLFLAIFAVLDEYVVQQHTMGRDASAMDFMVDLLGAVLILMLLRSRANRPAATKK
ncbi:MAG: hypothetical protein DRP45_08585 [Candidatus Zixiibacteriota bacterium]|nr:MAG: hypothetical protein DRP45_08585 [candidate division Zixibacteria bacterium]